MMIKEIRSDDHFAQGVKSFATNTLRNLADAHDAIIEARTFQANKANKRCGDEPAIAKGDLVYLLTKNLSLPKNRARKLCPMYIQGRGSATQLVGLQAGAAIGASEEKDTPGVPRIIAMLRCLLRK